MPEHTPIYNLPYLSEADMLKETPSIDEEFATAVENEIKRLNDRIDGEVHGVEFVGQGGNYYTKQSMSAPSYRNLHFSNYNISNSQSVKVSIMDKTNHSQGWTHDYSTLQVGDEMRLYMSEADGRWFKWRIASAPVYHTDGGVHDGSPVPYYSWDIDNGKVFNSTDGVVSGVGGFLFVGHYETTTKESATADVVAPAYNFFEPYDWTVEVTDSLNPQPGSVHVSGNRYTFHRSQFPWAEQFKEIDMQYSTRGYLEMAAVCLMTNRTTGAQGYCGSLYWTCSDWDLGTVWFQSEIHSWPSNQSPVVGDVIGFQVVR